MYALIYDDHNLEQPRKRVVSVHRSREAAEKALDKRKRRLGKTVMECNTRIIWTEGNLRAGDFIRPGQFSTWRPGETIPYGDLHSDSD